MNSAAVDFRTYRDEVALHKHAYHQIVLPRRGCLELEIDKRGGRVETGAGAFIQAGNAHAFAAKGDNRFVVIDLPSGCGMTNLFAQSIGDKPFFSIDSAVQGLLDYAAARLERDSFTTVAAATWTNLLLDSLLQADSNLPPEQIAVEKALAFMRSRLSDPIRIADICVAAGLSATRLYATFAKRCGDSPHATLARLRLDSAQRLLTGTRLSIAEIALRTGHGDQSNLTRQMRRILGVTPATLRRAGRCVSYD